ncbi:hypothetical protein CRV09_00795 [Candidatus Pantoea edessiphila]|uniref:YCII-related domain-containing protein n=1 Tax=Candidatus Pantoea edessiphila TaxID=2044610 RepID=A0A2P5T2K4_9GAMM|nr:YciI family protein [Candidatus Pantoea edessiphila]PPI88834.1 hypothetical protein CRV09_00795 [Candidatus Pantoea edessiphila]
MFYIIYLEHDTFLSKKKKNLKQIHASRVKFLQKEGRLIIYGYMPAVDSNDPGMSGFTGLTIIAEFYSLDDVQLWVEEDPYINDCNKLIIKPFKIIF